MKLFILFILFLLNFRISISLTCVVSFRKDPHSIIADVFSINVSISFVFNINVSIIVSI